MTFKFGKVSERNLSTPENGINVRPELVALCRAVIAISPRDFMIVDGMRTIAEQKINVAKGFSKTMKSKHLEGRAIDFAPILKGVAGSPDWTDLKGFQAIGALFKQQAKNMGLEIVWGGDWKWKDWGHIQLGK